ncbi:bifunctional ADP-dependent NAD(P)H-hydrate dehydratase/NAD(P)H-hydrate epimerase [Sinomonas mesophila]|uniref:bifunctional ADP-dependent NAD(P)H-hydrate dehydratase/NAD(P)H-hydrate epimerase n=1 Tax=Sinomonas mesophila TaxID=1531955 RepID=UPI000986DD42|nr:bifunctional ADP-dependent NAD(P)H-hydrate dehydratase/NAD(P)H-hydrate epimerase [Sinomonas mesophila]
MIEVFTGAQVRAAERPLLDAGAGPALMARAAHGLAGAVVRELKRTRGRVYGARVAAVVGKGNNGGDALFALAGLARRGVRTTAVLAAGSAHPEGLAAFGRAGGRVTEELEAAEVVVDAVLGTGFSGDYRPVLERPDALVVACDVPSGLDADTGEAGKGVWRADVTVTFGAAKLGLLLGRGRELAGRVEVVDIGLGPHLPEPEARGLGPADAAALLPAPRDGWHKYSRGVLGIVAGSERYPGAAALATAAASAAGVGMVRLVAPDAVRMLVLAECPEIVGSPEPEGRVQGWAVGPGIADDAGQLLALEAALASGLPAVVDASGLEALGEGTALGEHVVLTPHAGELAALLGRLWPDAPDRDAVEAEPLRWAREAAARMGVTVLLKGPTTVCAAPDGTAFVQPEGHPYLATAGSGDTLTGLLGALLATAGGGAGTDDGGAPRPVELAAAAALVHGTAGRIAAEAGPFGANALAVAVREAVRRLRPA